jgi:hypothetical protein
MEFVGTPDYASSAALMGMRPGPGGDLEALGFTLLELALGELPWWVQGRRTAGGVWYQTGVQRGGGGQQ